MFYSAEFYHTGVYHALWWIQTCELWKLNLKPVRRILEGSRWALFWLVGSILEPMLTNYSWFRLSSGLVAGAAPGSSWLAACEGGFPGIDFSNSRKQKLRPSLPNCQFEACHVVNLTLANSVLSIQAFVEGNFLDFLLGMRFKCL